MGLAEYKRKRDFKKTAEPKGAKGKPLPKAVKGASRFVIQKHDASRLHYDFRLEMDGVLKSWAVPKGIPWTQGEKHLAVEVEDHPVDYATFEGIIPKGQYGGGTVMVWDRGKYYVYGEEPLQALKDGRLHLVLDGEKAKGEWALIRLRGNETKPQWLLLKAGSSLKPLSKKRDDESAKTGRSMKQIASARDAEWESGRRDEDDSSARSTRLRPATARQALKRRVQAALKKKDDARDQKERPGLHRSTGIDRFNRSMPVEEGKRGGRRRRAGANSGTGSTSSRDDHVDLVPLGGIDLPSAKPRFIEPMKARLVEEAPTAGDWSYELKFDGFRACAVKDGRTVNLFSRNNNEMRTRFPGVAEALKQLSIKECVIDGEIVALDEEGRSSFQLLQAIELEGREAPLRFYVFDLLQLNGKSLLQLPLSTRKELLAKICEKVGDPIRYSGELGRDAKPLLAEIKKRGLEGLIGKLRDSIYETGRRSGTWIKLKATNEQEFVIGGYTPPGGSRKHFGAILAGYYEKGGLRFAGKVGTGFTEKTLSILHKKLRERKRDDCPFVDLPSKQGGKWVQGITPSMMRQMHWVEPKLVAQIKFAEWTRDQKLRQPVYLGLREDKNPRAITSEA